MIGLRAPATPGKKRLAATAIAIAISNFRRRWRVPVVVIRSLAPFSVILPQDADRAHGGLASGPELKTGSDRPDRSPMSADSTRVRVVLETERYRIVGDVTLPAEGFRGRLSDLLNREGIEFIP